MPREGQKSVTIPQYIWDLAEDYFNKHEKALRAKGIKSPSKLIGFWIERCSRE